MRSGTHARRARGARRWLRAAGAAMALAIAAAASAAHADDAPPSPRLILLISVDQFSADLFNSFRAEFHGGLRTLSQGVVYSNAFHVHGVTETCAGHAVIASGRHPNATGIIANQWYDQSASVDRYCTDDGTHVAARATRRLGVGPGMLEVSTLGDWLKAASPANRVFSVAGKDRSAIMMGGHRPDGAYWFDGKQGFDSWGASVAEAKNRLAPLATLNTALEKRLAGKPPVWTYANEGCRVREAQFPLGGGRVFRAQLPPGTPASIPGQPAASGPALPPYYYDDVTVDAAIDLIDGQRLGRASGTDLLAVGLSATDMVGHAYGTQGPEMCDQMARVDAQIARLLKRVEALGIPFVVALTADHGGADIPERLAARGYADAGRIDTRAMLADLNAAVRSAAGIDWDALRPAFFDPTQLVIIGTDGRALADKALKKRIADAAAARARTLPGIAAAWTASELAARKVPAGVSPDLLPVADRMALSVFAGRSGDVLLAADPLKVPAPPLPGLFMMGHSGPSDFNRRVPMLFWWPGAPHQERALPVAVVDLAPTLAALARVAPAAATDGHCLDLGSDQPACPRSPR
ncbi:putative AlkP superfamily pyrophosphatase or phosphodiesterase [Sphingopyxis panaciterrae]|uniref:alkaline phosphatase family protein n=1 Tax=Sphingopyxis panaciterrae TaxID=363841 RepID=UPI0014228DC5|nr:alkaline phosphatase family protein [Sphingopyxis panaciterrae]NIJ35922.1 putative AlkP superfamily pyrophosphatase or phosphodiesterase [Sphingopyxis panaciterrae]